MPFNLPAMAKRQGLRRSVTIRDIRPPAMFATDLYQVAYADIVTIWTEEAKLIAAEYARSLSELTTDSPIDLENTIANAERRASSVYFLLRPGLERFALRVERWQRQKWVSAILSASKVDISTMIGPADVRATLETTIARNVGLVRNVSDEARQKMSQAVFDGLRNRTPADEVGRRLREVADMTRRRARNIAADQSSKLAGALADERRRDAGISEWMWLHSGKLHPRAEHKARDGKVYSDDPATVGQRVEGKVIGVPPEDRPGQLPFCGCRSRGVINI